MLENDTDIEILSVSQLNAAARHILEENFPTIWVEGEISNLAIPSSGHIYFTLKDNSAQIRCAFFRGKNRTLNFSLENGLQLLVKASVSLYEGRGDYQLIVQQMELAGSGALRRQFELLKAKLAKENLFDAVHKKPIPSMPKTIGIITSPTGAAVRDILTTLKRRCPAVAIIIYPCPVQGTAATAQIIDALRTAERRNECDVLILARGGGSLEDLWCFNDENLAREIFKTSIPIVTGIGHEIDFTIADLVADMRAATPTAAAELVSPNQLQWIEELNYKKNRLLHFIMQKIKLTKFELHSISKQLRHPGQIIREQIQTVDFAEQKLHLAMTHVLQRYQTQLTELKLKLKHVSPQKNIAEKEAALQKLLPRLSDLAKKIIHNKQQILQHLARSLNAVSPLATLERGYTISRDPKTHKVMSSVNEITINSAIEVMFVDGNAECLVNKIQIKSNQA